MHGIASRAGGPCSNFTPSVRGGDERLANRPAATGLRMDRHAIQWRRRPFERLIGRAPEAGLGFSFPRVLHHRAPVGEAVPSQTFHAMLRTRAYIALVDVPNYGMSTRGDLSPRET